MASDDETFEVDAQLEAVLLESIAQGERGEVISAENLLEELALQRISPKA